MLTYGDSASENSRARFTQSVLKNRRFLYFLIAMIPVELVFFQPMAAMPLFLVRDLHFTEAGYGMLFAVNTVIIILVEVPLNMAMSSGLTGTHWPWERSWSALVLALWCL